MDTEARISCSCTSGGQCPPYCFKFQYRTYANKPLDKVYSDLLKNQQVYSTEEIAVNLFYPEGFTPSRTDGEDRTLLLVPKLWKPKISGVRQAVTLRVRQSPTEGNPPHARWLTSRPC